MSDGNQLARLALVGVGSMFGPWGTMAGSIAGSLLFPGELPDIEGPRLIDRRVTSSTLGSPINRVNGTFRTNGNIIWSSGIKETKHEEDSGGKGGPSQTETSYTYDSSFAVALCEGKIKGVRKIWADGVLIYNVGSSASATQVLLSNQSSVTIYDGSENQLPDSTIQSSLGVNDTPAHRGLCYLLFNQLQLETYGNRIPSITAEVVGDGDEVAGLVDPVYSYSGFDRFEDTTYFDGIYFYRYKAIRAANGLSFAVHSEKWSAGQKKIEFGMWTYLSELGVSASDNGVYSFDPDEPGFLLKKTTTAAPWVLTYAKYDSSDVIDFDIGAPTGNLSDIWATKSGDHFYFVFAVAFSSGKFIKYAKSNWPMSPYNHVTAVDVGWPDTVTPGTISNLPTTIASDASYMYLACVDSVELNVIVRYALSDPLTPLDWKSVDYAGTPWKHGFDAYNGTLISCIADGSDLILHTYITWDAVLSTEISALNNTYTSGGSTEALHIWQTADYTAIWGDDRFNLGEAGVEYANLSSNTVTLSSVITAICKQSGLTAVDIDVSSLIDTVKGYLIDAPMTNRSAIDPLINAYNVVAYESDWKIKFKKLGSDVPEAVDSTLLGANDDDFDSDLIPTKIGMDSELPRRLTIQYNDLNRDYLISVQKAQRIITNV